MRGTFAKLAVTALLVSLPSAARPSDAQPAGLPSLPSNVAVVEFSAPPGTQIRIDGHDKTSGQRLTFGPLPSGRLERHEVSARFATGRTVSKMLLVQSGVLYHVPLRDPQAEVPQLVLQTGHSGAVWSVAFSPDGKHVATASGDRTAILWDAAGGAELRTFEGHAADVSSLSFAPDGQSILTASWDQTAVLWNVATGARRQTFEGYACAALSPDGKRVLTGSLEKSASLWDTLTGKRLRSFEGDSDMRERRAARHGPRQEEEVSAVAFSADGTHALTGEAGNIARLWDTRTAELLGEFKGHQGSVDSVAFSPDGKTVLTGAWDNLAILWDAATGGRVRVFAEHNRGSSFLFPQRHCVSSVAFSPDGKSVLTGSWDKTAILSDVATGTELHAFKGHKDFVTSVAFSPDGKRVLCGSREGTAVLWDASSGERIRSFDGQARLVAAIAYSTDERLLLTGYQDGTAIFWDTVKGNRLGRLETHHRNVASVAFSPGGEEALTGSVDGAILWNVATKKRLRTFPGSVESMAFSVLS